MTSLLIAGGRVVDPANRVDGLRDLRIRDGRIVELGEHLAREKGDEILDATGAIVAPGFVDMHVHLREPGFPEKETIETGTAAAVRGGFSAVACMPNTNPTLDNPAILSQLEERVSREGVCRVYPIAAITLRRAGARPCDFPALARAGAVAFSDDGDSVQNAAVLRDAALQGRDLSQPFISHCDEPEDVFVARDLLIAAETQKTWHMAHLSTRRSLDLIRDARAAGGRATCEVTPHHLSFTAAAAAELGPAARVNPPLHGEEDVRALRDAVRDGTIDAFASDHAPHTREQKSGAHGEAAPGFSGLEIAAGAYAAALPDLPLRRFVELISVNPARILAIPGGTLSEGAPADVTIFAERSWIVDPATFASKGRCTPFAGQTLPRKVLTTIVGGAIRYNA